MNTMLLKLLALWPLLLLQIPTASMSNMSSSEGDFGNLVEIKSDDESSGSSHEQPEERFQAQPNQLLLDMSKEESERLLCEKLEETMLKWGLALLTNEELDPNKPLCGLQLDPQKTVDANADILAKQVFYGLAIDPKSIRKSETGNILILPFEKGGEARSRFSAKGRQYVLRGGIGKIKHWRLDLIAYIDFNAEANVVSADGFKNDSFITYRADGCFFKGLGKNRVLPRFISSLNNNPSYHFTPKYLFYKDVGPLEAPYPIPHLGLSDKLLTYWEVEQALGLEMVDKRTLSNGVRLIRLVQLWKELYPGYKGKHPDCTFENPDLEKLNKKLEALGDDATKKEKKELLLAACEFILQPNAEDNDASDIDEGEDVRDEYLFLRALMEKESKVGESFAIELNDHLALKETVGKDVCSNLFSKLAFYRDGNIHLKTVPYEIKIDCQGRPATFRLIARITQSNILSTYGTDYDFDEAEQILKVAEYGHEPPVHITYLPVDETKKISLKVQCGLLIYQYMSDGRRTKGAK